MNRREFLKGFIKVVGIISLSPVLSVESVQKPDMIIIKKTMGDTVYKIKKMQWELDGKPKVIDRYRKLLNSLEN